MLSVCATGLPGGPAYGQAATLEDLWNGNASFVFDRVVGGNVGLTFPSVLIEGNTLAAYHIRTYVDGDVRFATARARSTDGGVSWIDDGIVLDVGGAPEWVFEAGDLLHQIGRAVAGGWSADPALDGPGYLCFGPYTTVIPGGANCAAFKLMIDQRSGLNEIVVTLDVYDADADAVLGTRNVRRGDFTANSAYQTFQVNFTSIAGRRLELRTYWHDRAYVQQDMAGVARGSAPFWDGRMASFPGVWKDNGVYYMVYEGAGAGNNPGDIGLATSTDGLHFTRAATNPILRHQTTGWERTNIGTPSLYKENDVWYLFYHGYDATDCRIGVATGPALTNLTRYAGNPILSTVSNSWESGTCGRRSAIQKIGSYYYWAYEGSTEAPFEAARWSSGVARSSDLLDWTRLPANPVVAQTLSGFGNDGPELVVSGGVTYLYVRRAPTDRYRLMLDSAVPPQITQQPADANVCPGADASFTVQVSSTTPISYQWQRGGIDLAEGGDLSGARSASLQVSNADISDLGAYRCVVTNGGGSVVSQSAALALRPATTITQQPTSEQARLGETVSLTLAATGEGAISFQWLKNGDDLADGGHYWGVHAPGLTISSISEDDFAVYACRVTAGCGSTVSASATLSLAPIPGDFDGDRDVDISDFARLQRCMTGPGVLVVDPNCVPADLTGNGSVDPLDLEVFLRCLSGPNVLAADDCGD